MLKIFLYSRIGRWRKLGYSCLVWFHCTVNDLVLNRRHRRTDQWTESAWHPALANTDKTVNRLCSRLSTIGKWAFPVAASRLWNTLSPQNVTSAPSPTVLQETPHLFSRSFLEFPAVRVHWPRNFGHHNRSFYLYTYLRIICELMYDAKMLAPRINASQTEHQNRLSDALQRS